MWSRILQELERTFHAGCAARLPRAGPDIVRPGGPAGIGHLDPEVGSEHLGPELIAVAALHGTRPRARTFESWPEPILSGIPCREYTRSERSGATSTLNIDGAQWQDSGQVEKGTGRKGEE